MYKPFLVVLAATTLAGCTSGSSESGVAAAVVQNVALSDTFEITENPDGTFTVSDGSVSSILEKESDAFNGGTSYYASSDGVEVLLMQTPSGNGEAYALLISSFSPYPEADGAILVRNGETAIPQSGTATFNGFSATWRFGSGVSVSEGVVELRASFNTSTIEGEITDRNRFGQTDPRPDIQLNPGTISEGEFSGTTTGGYFGGTASGTYSGLFVGPNAEELVGQWQLDDPDDATRGAFWAAQ